VAGSVYSATVGGLVNGRAHTLTVTGTNGLGVGGDMLPPNAATPSAGVAPSACPVGCDRCHRHSRQRPGDGVVGAIGLVRPERHPNVYGHIVAQ
jgi:hypothetical protein